MRLLNHEVKLLFRNMPVESRTMRFFLVPRVKQQLRQAWKWWAHIGTTSVCELTAQTVEEQVQALIGSMRQQLEDASSRMTRKQDRYP